MKCPNEKATKIERFSTHGEFYNKLMGLAKILFPYRCLDVITLDFSKRFSKEMKNRDFVVVKKNNNGGEKYLRETCTLASAFENIRQMDIYIAGVSNEIKAKIDEELSDYSNQLTLLKESNEANSIGKGVSPKIINEVISRTNKITEGSVGKRHVDKIETLARSQKKVEFTLDQEIEKEKRNAFEV